MYLLQHVEQGVWQVDKNWKGIEHVWTKRNNNTKEEQRNLTINNTNKEKTKEIKLTKDQIKRLERLGFVWALKNKEN